MVGSVSNHETYSVEYNQSNITKGSLINPPLPLRYVHVVNGLIAEPFASNPSELGPVFDKWGDLVAPAPRGSHSVALLREACEIIEALREDSTDDLYGNYVEEFLQRVRND